MHIKRFENYNFQRNCLIFFDAFERETESHLRDYFLEYLMELTEFLRLKNLTVFCLPIYNQSFGKDHTHYESSLSYLFDYFKKKYNTEILSELSSIEEKNNKRNVFLLHPSLANLQILFSLNLDGFIIDSYKFFIESQKDSFFNKIDKNKITLSSQVYETIQILEQILSNKTKPKLCILGGNQIQESIQFLSNTVKYFQNLLLGGSIGITALKANAVDVGNSPYSSEELSDMFQIMNKAEFEECEVNLPIDHLVTEKIVNTAKLKTSPKEISSPFIAVDIGSKTIQNFENKIKETNLVLMHGPLGVLELEKAQGGTLQILKTIHKLQKPKIISGISLCDFAIKNKIHGKFVPDFEFTKQFFNPNSKLFKFLN
ncbi:MAG: phosphoglycerate kinase [Leptonema sp. (in: bacteria)]